VALLSSLFAKQAVELSSQSSVAVAKMITSRLNIWVINFGSRDEIGFKVELPVAAVQDSIREYVLSAKPLS